MALNSRYVPNDSPPSQVFNVTWIRVDVSGVLTIQEP